MVTGQKVDFEVN